MHGAGRWRPARRGAAPAGRQLLQAWSTLWSSRGCGSPAEAVAAQPPLASPRSPAAAHPAETSKSTSHTSPSLQRRPTPLLGSHAPSASLLPTMQMSWPKWVRYGNLKERRTFLLPARGRWVASAVAEQLLLRTLCDVCLANTAAHTRARRRALLTEPAGRLLMESDAGKASACAGTCTGRLRAKRPGESARAEQLWQTLASPLPSRCPCIEHNHLNATVRAAGTRPRARGMTAMPCGVAQRHCSSTLPICPHSLAALPTVR
jgi:hypothetical protein